VLIARTLGKTISTPVWFVLEGDNLYLLPMQGSDTQWYRNAGLANYRAEPTAKSVW
jgi:hypothetical protein